MRGAVWVEVVEAAGRKANENGMVRGTRGKNLITQRSTSKQVLHGENVENLCMWKVASEKNLFYWFSAQWFSRAFFSSHLQETTTTTRGKIFSVLGVIQKRKISAVVCCKNREQAHTSSAHTFSCYNIYEMMVRWGAIVYTGGLLGSRNGRWCKYKEFMQL